MDERKLLFGEFLRQNPQHVAGVREEVFDGQPEAVGDTETMCAFADWCVENGHTSWEKATTLKAFLRQNSGGHR